MGYLSEIHDEDKLKIETIMQSLGFQWTCMETYCYLARHKAFVSSLFESLTVHRLPR